MFKCKRKLSVYRNFVPHFVVVLWITFNTLSYLFVFIIHQNTNCKVYLHKCIKGLEYKIGTLYLEKQLK